MKLLLSFRAAVSDGGVLAAHRAHFLILFSFLSKCTTLVCASEIIW